MGANDYISDPLQRLLTRARQMGLERKTKVDHHLYGQFKRELDQLNVDHVSYQRACTEIARACGV